MPELEILWPAPAAAVTLAAKDVHVWAVALDLDPVGLETLNADERARAGRYRFERDRNRFIAGRATLRRVLGYYARHDPAGLEFAYGPQGKPSLAGADGTGGLHFNLAHSGGLGLLAVTRACKVGVDVEQVSSSRDIQGIAERFFSASEVAALNAWPVGDRPEGFFKLWTCKEAWLKATGEGIARALDQIEVSLPAAGPPRLLALHGDSTGIGGWTMQELNPATGYQAALAAPAIGLNISCRRWPEETGAINRK